MEHAVVIERVKVRQAVTGEEMILERGERLVETTGSEYWLHRCGVSFCLTQHVLRVERNGDREVVVESEDAHMDNGSVVAISPWPPAWLAIETQPGRGPSLPEQAPHA